jgi:hypothetical protein
VNTSAIRPRKPGPQLRLPKAPLLTPILVRPHSKSQPPAHAPPSPPTPTRYPTATSAHPHDPKPTPTNYGIRKSQFAQKCTFPPRPNPLHPNHLPKPLPNCRSPTPKTSRVSPGCNRRNPLAKNILQHHPQSPILDDFPGAANSSPTTNKLQQPRRPACRRGLVTCCSI